MSEKNGPVRVTITVEASPCTEEFEIARADWEAMSPAQRRAELDDLTQVAISNAGGAGWRIDDLDDLADTDD